jgi:predicted AAA+ superfamily ATPase
MDLSKKRPVWQRERKLYPADPFLLHALRAWGTPSLDPAADSKEWARDPLRRGRLVEAAVMANLAFGAPAGLMGGAQTSVRLTYLRTRGGREVDAVVSEGGRRTPVEVKTGDGAKVDRKAMSLVGPGVIVTADTTDLGTRPRQVAAPLFLYLLPGPS